MELPELDAGTILSVLEKHDVRFVLIGGLAATVHGSPFPTEDIDLTPDSSAQNLGRLSDALRELDAEVRAAELDEALPFSHDATSLAAVRVWNLVTPHGVLDIWFVPTGTQGYPDLARAAVDVTIFGVVVKVAALADIIRSKQAANRAKDQRVLPTLREILARREMTPGT